MENEELHFAVGGPADDLKQVMLGLNGDDFQKEPQIRNKSWVADLTPVIIGLAKTAAFYNFLKWAGKKVRLRVKCKTPVAIEFEFDPDKEEQKEVLFKCKDVAVWVGNSEPPRRK